MILRSESLADTERIAADWLIKISSSALTDEALVVGLSGHLGSGKTAFVKCLAKTLQIHEEVTSPTFVIMKIYPIAKSRFKKLVHIDAYRLTKSQELAALGFENLVSDPTNLIMIEWPENVRDVLPVATHRLSFEIVDDGRRISID